MAAQPVPIIYKQGNQPHRECLFAWYPEIVNINVTNVSMEPRVLCLHTDLDKNQSEQKPFTDDLASACNSKKASIEPVQNQKQTTEASNQVYHSIETIDQALTPPWALHYDIQRRPLTPNPSTHSSDMSTHEEQPRRLKSAPATRSLPSTTILTIPEPRLINYIVPFPIANQISSPSAAKARAKSAKARLNTTVPNEISQQRQQQQRDTKSARVSRSNVDKKLTEEEVQQIFKQVYGDQTPQLQSQQRQQPPVQIIYTQPQAAPAGPSPVYIYTKSSSWHPGEVSTSPFHKSLQENYNSANPLHVHRPSLVSVGNNEKKSILRASSAARKTVNHYHKYYRHSPSRKNEPLYAFTPTSQKPRLTLEIDGVKLKHDPTLTLDDPSPTLTKYFIDGRLYLINDQYYNVIDDIDLAKLEKYNQNLTQNKREKCYRTIPIENFRLSPSSLDMHRQTSSSKYMHNCLVNPNFISENLNVNKMSLSKRPPTTTIYA